MTWSVVFSAATCAEEVSTSLSNDLMRSSQSIEIGSELSVFSQETGRAPLSREFSSLKLTALGMSFMARQ